MRVIDCHCHIYPQKIAHKAVEAIGDFYHIPMQMDGTIGTLLKEGGLAGVTDFLVHSVATTPHQVKSVNEFVAKEVSLFPDKLIGFGTLHPESQDIKGDIEHLIALGLKGVKLHPDFLGIPIDDERYFEIYERAEGRLPICFHTGDDRYDYSNPNRVAPLLKRFPNLTVIAAHFGGYTVWEEASYALAGAPNLYVDCSSSLFALTPKKATEIVRRYGADRVLFGTDYPMWNPRGELERFDKLDLTQSERENILFKNAEALLGLSPSVDNGQANENIDSADKKVG